MSDAAASRVDLNGRIARLALYRWWRRTVVARVDHEAVVARIVEESGWSPRFAFMTMMSAGIGLNAAALLDQYRCPTGDVLLVLDDDCPFEEQLYLVVMRGSSVLDHVVVGAPYTAGQYRLMETGVDLLRFQFECERVWTVRVHAGGTRGLGGLPSGARRETGWLNTRYLTLTWDEAG